MDDLFVFLIEFVTYLEQNRIWREAFIIYLNEIGAANWIPLIDLN